MKSIVLSSVTVALLVFSGCSDKAPAVDESLNGQNTQEVAPVGTETVATDDSSVNGANGSNLSSSQTKREIEQQLPTIYFAFDKFDVVATEQAKLERAAELGKTKAQSYNVKLEGNCDEWGSDEYNFALGLKRANAVKEALVADGIDAKRISMVSFGESNPVCTDKTQECWAKNRRVNFKLLP